MRIFITGAQGTGKSTLVKRLEEELPSLHTHDSMSREFMDYKDEQFGEDFQYKISLYCLDMYVNDHDFISSRSYFDSIAYPSMNEKYNGIVDMVRLYKKYLFQDDCIYFYLPIEFNISSDGNDLRCVDKEYQRKIDNLIRLEIASLSKEEQEKVITLHGSVEERMDQIMKALL